MAEKELKETYKGEDGEKLKSQNHNFDIAKNTISDGAIGTKSQNSDGGIGKKIRWRRKN
jgi:hypothetical protein